MVSYKELGLVNTKEMFAKAIKGGYAVPAFNFNNMEQLQAIIKAAADEKSPVILQVSKGARNYANPILLRFMAQGAVEYAKSLGWEHPEIVLHLDHGDSFELCKDCIENGFSSVMIDGSHLPYEENVALTKKVCDYPKEIATTVRQLEMFPDEGPYLQDLIEYPTDYHYLVVKPNYIFYRIEGDTVRIIRILNEKQDFLQILFGISSISEEGENYWEEMED